MEDAPFSLLIPLNNLEPLDGAVGRFGGVHDSDLADVEVGFELIVSKPDYFELTEFPATHHAAQNVHVSATESGRDIVFLHEIQSGPASKSYGIQVARLAGMPAAVLNQARHTLEALETQATQAQAQVDLFAAPAASTLPPASAADQALADIDPDKLSPREALDALYQLKKLLTRG